MPAFVLIAGYFSKSQTLPKLGGLLAQYVVFQTLYLLFNRFVLGNTNTPFSYIMPYWILWFLVSCLLWKMCIPFISRLPAPVALAITVMLSVLAGYDDLITRYLSLSRTLVFFPFFLLGYYAQKKHFALLKKVPKLVAVLLILLSFWQLHLAPGITGKFLYAANPYEDFPLDGPAAGITRLVCLAWGFVLICCFFVLVPTRRQPYSLMGQRTLQVFLLHGFAIRYIQYKTPLPGLLTTPLLRFAFIMGLLVFSLLLMAKPVAAFFAPLCNPVAFVKKIMAKRVRPPKQQAA